MRNINQQAVIGALIAAILTIGATAGSSRDTSGGLSPLSNGPANWLAGTFEVCADTALDRALDAYGTLIAQLRQI